MITLIIDDKEVTVPSGTTILQAANAAGVKVPTLCHDERLNPYGACRLCMVEVMGTPRRMVAACTTPAAEGMVVKTMSPPILEARKAILELLLINHPLDCPVCDKAGDCRLQDLVHEYGPGQGKFAEEKRTLPSDYASAAIERNASRCILCGKCVRICREQNGVGELAFTRRGGRSRISTCCDRPLDCEFCGECVEICPVGALSTKQFKFKARVWNLEESGSACLHCGCGCAVKLQTGRGRLVRVAPADNNYLCARGRFGWDAVHHDSRLTMPKIKVNGEFADCTWDEALSRVAEALQSARARRGPTAIGGLGSVRTTNEDNYLFQKFLRSVITTNNVDLLARLKLPKGLNASFFSSELKALAESDAVLVLDAEAGEINPLTGIEIVRAVKRKGKKLVLLQSGYNKFNRIASVVLKSGSRKAVLDDLIGALQRGGASVDDGIRKAADLLMAAESVALVLPAEYSTSEHDRIQELARLLRQPAFIPLIRRGNLQGALDMGVLPHYLPGYQNVGAETSAAFKQTWHAELPAAAGMNAVEMLSAIGSGALAALYVMGDDPVGNSPEIAPLFRKLDFLVVQDIFMTETAKLADVVLPAASFAERAGTVTNLERRLRRLEKAEEPAGEARADWQIIQALAREMGVSWKYASSSDILKEIKAIVPAYRDLAVGACWPKELSPLAGTNGDLSLTCDSILKREVIFADRLLFSSGMMITRSKEVGTLAEGNTGRGTKAGQKKVETA